MTLFKFFAQIRFLTLAVLLVMILMRLVWMDLRVYDVQVDPRFLNAMAHMNESGPTCQLRGSDALRWNMELQSSEVLPTWQRSKIYHAYVRMSCKEGQFSRDSYVRMNQGILVLTILCCILICRLYCRSWVLFFAVAAILLSRGRYIAANGTISGHMLTSLLLTIWCLSLFHFLRTGSRLGFVLHAIGLLILLWLEASLWPVAWAFTFAITLSYLARGRLLRPLLNRMRQTQTRERLYAQALSTEPLRSDLWNASKFGQNVKRLLGLVRPPDWAYQPLSRKFMAGSLFRPLQVPFLLWAYHGRQWPLLVKKGLLLGLLALAASILWAKLMSQGTLELASPLAALEMEWFRVLIRRIDLDLAIVLIILALALSFGPAAGLVSYWESTFVLILLLPLGAMGVWLWDAISFDLSNAADMNLWRANLFVLWFEPVLLTFGALGLYNFLRVLDRALFRTNS